MTSSFLTKETKTNHLQSSNSTRFGWFPIKTNPLQFSHFARLGSYQIKTNPLQFSHFARLGSYQIKTNPLQFSHFARLGSYQIKAFTLAEVLITLVVIGVIATLTVPTLMKNYKWAVRKAQLKEAQSVLAQGISKYRSENGISNMYNFIMNGDETNTNSYYTTEKSLYGEVISSRYVFNATLYTVLSSTFKNLEYCNQTLSKQKLTELGIKTADPKTCKEIFNTKYHIFNGEYRTTHIHTEYDRLILPEKNFSFGYGGSGSKLALYVDVNGYNKGPNRDGHDVFGFRLKEDGTVIPCGTPGYSCASYDYIDATYKALNDPNYWKDNNIK